MASTPIAEGVPSLPVPGIEPTGRLRGRRRLRSRRTPACSPADAAYVIQAQEWQDALSPLAPFAPLAFDAAFVEGSPVHTQFHPWQWPETKDSELTVVPRILGSCQQTQELLEEGSRDWSVLPRAFGWYRLLA